MLPFLIQYVNLQAKPPSEERSLSVNLIMLLLSLKPFRGSTLPTGWSPNSQQHREGPSGCGLYWPPTPHPRLIPHNTPSPASYPCTSCPEYALLCVFSFLYCDHLQCPWQPPLPATHWFPPAVQDAVQVSSSINPLQSHPPPGILTASQGTQCRYISLSLWFLAVFTYITSCLPILSLVPDTY